MPRAIKSKVAVGKSANQVGKKAGAAKKGGNKLYSLPEKIKEGTILTDLAKGQWQVGPSIGIGGFGEIYSACRVGEKSYNYVVKCEPHGNGPLFVEMHFYMRNAKLEDIEKFKRQHGLKSLGMPYMLGNGSAEINGQKHRFIVMPRYGSDIVKYYKANGNRLPEGTIYRLAVQMLDVYQYVHSSGYVHADLKAANILLGLGKGGASQAFLVDYGLASHYTTKEFKPDPKKMHNGTIEYTSRDAHQGVATMRADLEILGYNIIEWMGVQLPWVRDNLLVPPTKAQKAKEEFMSNISTELSKLFPKGVPVAISEFMKYVSNMSYNETPDYDKCRNIFLNALKQIRVPMNGDLNFNMNANTDYNHEVESPAISKAKAVTRKERTVKPAAKVKAFNYSSDVICASDDDDSEVFEPRKAPKTIAASKIDKIITPGKATSPARPIVSPKAQSKNQPKAHTPSRASPRKRLSTTPQSPPKQKRQKKHGTPGSSQIIRGSPRNLPSSSTKINFSPSISLRSRPGKTIINDNLTPNARSSKTYEFNFELDVSMDANVIVNVKRKKKATASNSSSSISTKSGERTGGTPTRRHASNGITDTLQSSDIDSPVTRVNVKKVSDDTTVPNNSPRTPAVTLRKYRH